MCFFFFFFFYRCLNKIVYARFPACSSINNSSGQHSCPKLRPNYMLMKVLQMRLLLMPLFSPSHRQKGQKPFRSLRNLKTDLDLTVEGDLNIVMAFAEKLRGGLHSFVFGKPFYTSVQERDALMSFWIQLRPLSDVCGVLVLHACMHVWGCWTSLWCWTRQQWPCFCVFIVYFSHQAPYC